MITTPPVGRTDYLMAEQTDSVLVKRFLCGFHPSTKANHALWSYVMRAFGCGSTVAYHICKRHGFDPEMRVKARSLTP